MQKSEARRWQNQPRGIDSIRCGIGSEANVVVPHRGTARLFFELRAPGGTVAEVSTTSQRWQACERLARAARAVRFAMRRKKQRHPQGVPLLFGDSWQNRTAVLALRGPCLSRLTNEPYFLLCYFSIESGVCQVFWKRFLRKCGKETRKIKSKRIFRTRGLRF